MYTHRDKRFYGVMVSTQDSESCDPSSNLGRTFLFESFASFDPDDADTFDPQCKCLAVIAQLGEC